MRSPGRRTRCASALGGLDGLASGNFDRVLALDCAYHFAPRFAFFAQAHRTLKPNGILALTDILLADGQNAKQHARLAKICGIPSENLRAQSDYAQSLVALGFIDVTFNHLDDEVLKGFAQFALRHLRVYALDAIGASGLKILTTAVVAAWLQCTPRIHYVLITATRAHSQ